MPDSLFVDTSGWASLFINTQPHHGQAEQYPRQAIGRSQPLITTNYVIGELVALLGSPIRVPRTQIFEIVDAIKTVPYVQIIHIDAALDATAWSLCKKRPDKDWSLMDCTSFVLMEQLNIAEALTTDHHFEQSGFIRLLK